MGKPLNVLKEYKECLDALDEFVRAIENEIGLPPDDMGMAGAALRKDFPDLCIAYEKARKLVRDD